MNKSRLLLITTLLLGTNLLTYYGTRWMVPYGRAGEVEGLVRSQGEMAEYMVQNMRRTSASTLELSGYTPGLRAFITGTTGKRLELTKKYAERISQTGSRKQLQLTYEYLDDIEKEFKNLLENNRRMFSRHEEDIDKQLAKYRTLLSGLREELRTIREGWPKPVVTARVRLLITRAGNAYIDQFRELTYPGGCYVDSYYPGVVADLASDPSQDSVSAFLFVGAYQSVLLRDSITFSVGGRDYHPDLNGQVKLKLAKQPDTVKLLIIDPLTGQANYEETPIDLSWFRPCQ